MSKTRTITPNPPADFVPSKNDVSYLRPFRVWCQKVLPLVYDDSLSYYELLCKVVDFLNKTMEEVNQLGTDVSNLFNAFQQLQDYVNHYFDNLDVQEEINNKLDEMFAEGTLEQIIGKAINKYIEGNLLFNALPISRLNLNDLKGDFTTTSFQCCCYNSDNGNILLGFSSLPTASDPNMILLVLCNKSFEVLSRYTFSVPNSHINDCTYNKDDKCYYLAYTRSDIIGKINNTFTELSEVPCTADGNIYQISYFGDGVFYVTYNNTIYSTKDFAKFTKIYTQPQPIVDNALYDNIRSCAYQGSEIIQGSFVSIMWLYGNPNTSSYCRLYVYIPTANTPKFYDIEMSETYDEPEGILYDGNKAYILGYVGSYLTRQIVSINGLLVSKWGAVITDIAHSFTSLSDVPINSAGYFTLSKDISPVSGSTWSGPYECIGYGSRRVIKTYRSNGDVYTTFYDGSSWGSWDKQLHADIGINYTSLSDIPVNSSGFFNLSEAISPVSGSTWSGPYECVGYDLRRVIKTYRSNGDVYTAFYDGTSWSSWVKQLHAYIGNNYTSLSDVPVNSSGFFNLSEEISPVSSSTWSGPYECVGYDSRRVIKTYRSNGDIFIAFYDGTNWNSWVTK